MNRIFLLTLFAAVAFTGASARAEDKGHTSGPSAGSPVLPPTVVQKDNTHIDANPSGVSGPSGTAAGAPGVEGGKGTQSGQDHAR